MFILQIEETPKLYMLILDFIWWSASDKICIPKNGWSKLFWGCWTAKFLSLANKNLSELNKMPSLMFSQLSFDTLFSQIWKLKLKSSHYADIKNLDQPLIGTCRNILESSWRCKSYIVYPHQVRRYLLSVVSSIMQRFVFL